MGNTYDTLAEAETDRGQQRSLLTALNGWDRALCRDECSAWRIAGKHGRIYTWGDGKTWVLHVTCQSPKQWTYAKQRLEFCEVTQDCAWEGCLRLHHLPTTERAELIRDILGIRKKMEVSAETLERLRSIGFKSNPRPEARIRSNIGVGRLPRYPYGRPKPRPKKRAIPDKSRRQLQPEKSAMPNTMPPRR